MSYIVGRQRTSSLNVDVTSLDVALPAGAALGSVVVVVLAGNKNPGTITAPDLTVRLARQGAGSALRVGDRVIDGTEGGSVTISWATAETAEAWAFELAAGAAIEVLPTPPQVPARHSTRLLPARTVAHRQ